MHSFRMWATWMGLGLLAACRMPAAEVPASSPPSSGAPTPVVESLAPAAVDTQTPAPAAAALDALPIAELPKRVAPSNTAGTPLRVRVDRTFSRPGVRIRIEEVMHPSASVRAAIRRTLAVYFDDAVAELEETRAPRITCRALLALTTIVSYECTSTGEIDDYDGGATYTYRETMNLAIDGERVRPIDDDEIVSLSESDLAEIACRFHAPRLEDCEYGEDLQLALEPSRLVIRLHREGFPIYPMVRSRVPFEAFGWLLEPDGVLARIPGALAHVTGPQRVLVDEDEMSPYE